MKGLENHSKSETDWGTFQGVLGHVPRCVLTRRGCICTTQPALHNYDVWQPSGPSGAGSVPQDHPFVLSITLQAACLWCHARGELRAKESMVARYLDKVCPGHCGQGHTSCAVRPAVQAPFKRQGCQHTVCPSVSIRPLTVDTAGTQAQNTGISWATRHTDLS